MNELFKILGLVAIDNEGAISALKETTGQAEESHVNISKALTETVWCPGFSESRRLVKAGKSATKNLSLPSRRAERNLGSPVCPR